jgi:hypothetical protein
VVAAEVSILRMWFVIVVILIILVTISE